MAERVVVAPAAPAATIGFSDPSSSVVPFPCCESGENVEGEGENVPGLKELMREEEGREGELSWRMTRAFSLR